MNWDLVSAVVFYGIVALIIYIYRKKIKVIDKVFITYRTKKGLNFMRNLAKYKLFWKIFSTLAIPVVVGGMLLIGYSLFKNLIAIVNGVGGQGVQLLVPGFTVPFWPSIIAIAVLVIVHEFSHGIVAAMEGIKLKSVGVGLFTILPLAFVELDEKQMMKKSKLARLRVLSAGPFANVVTWGILFGFLSLVVAPVLNGIIIYDGVNINTVENGTPAYLSGLEKGDVITAINNNSIGTINEFITVMKNINPGDKITITANNTVFNVTTIANPSDSSRPYIGIVVTPVSHISQSAREKYGTGLDVFLWSINVIKWIALINLFVGLINCIPVWAIDGGRVMYDLLGYVIKSDKIKTLLLHTTSAIYITLIVFNFIGPWLFKIIG